ncbi:hypothetical protein BD410DRAFT_786464 [Rickenella mellea]|uniref:Uncharacterized protein n=1 Tax=Rickenella mellea TaxID=50990 RepID=A0A4Y7QB99_9AGAM|nr:hypothetical protein BD410DRAFT_786464 [Rickenella mellea]
MLMLDPASSVIYPKILNGYIKTPFSSVFSCNCWNHFRLSVDASSTDVSKKNPSQRTNSTLELWEI